MIGLFKRAPRAAPIDTSALGESALAMVVPAGSAQAPGCTAVLIDLGGRSRRIEASARLAPAAGEVAWLFRPGPYHCELRPFAAAPEIGLQLSFVIDSPDPRAHQQRFDLYLASELGAATGAAPIVLACADFFAAIEATLQRELAQGHLDLPPCTSLAEWNSFRAGLNRLLYLRFGVTVTECLPVDLGGRVDFCAILSARAASGPLLQAEEAAATVPYAPQEPPPAHSDALSMRRLFLELPGVMCALRVAVLPRGPLQFRRHQALLRRLDLVSLQVTTMPAFELAAPGVALDHGNRVRRARHALGACQALDDAWALLARFQAADDQAHQVDNAPAADLDALFDDAERIVANLEDDAAGRRAVAGLDDDAVSAGEPA